ncbi:alpha/beta hydrolase [Paenibacillus sp. GCM10023252]|uniref:alpha/beta hydrolase n=1 Tax=Paenibacillus sp. GCM10023252 TaxID=3252649 RepID=UPI00360F3DDC
MSTTALHPSLPLELPQPMLPMAPPPPLALPEPEADTRSRRKHLWIAAVSTITVIALLVGLVFHGYVAWMLAHPYVAPLHSNPKDAIGLDYTAATFPSASGRTTVDAWYVPAADDGGRVSSRGAALPSTRTVIFSHGYGANREETWVPMYTLTSLLHGLHYNVLMFDYGYASKEHKAPATGGWEEAKQLLAAVDYAKGQGAEDITVWGFSMGAGTALQAALQTDEIDAMILDSLFLPSSEALFNNLRQFVELPRFPSLPLIEAILPVWTGTSFGGIPAEQVLATAYDMPIYIVHGTEDAKAPFQTAEAISTGQSDPLSRSWIVPGGKHELLFQVHPQEYIQRAALFLGQVDGKLQAERSLAMAH